MSKKAAITIPDEIEEIIDEADDIEETPEPAAPPAKTTPVNLFKEVPKPAKKEKEPFNKIDLSPILDKLGELDQRLTNLVESKPEPKDKNDKNLIEELGNW